MKTRIFAFMMLLASVTFGAMAQGGYDYKQDPKYGNTPEERERNVMILNYFNDAYKMRTYDDAVAYMQELIQNAPQASENIFIKGIEIYRNKLSRSRVKAERAVFLDSMMYIYDKRAETYGDHATRGRGYILTRKAQDFYIYAPGETDRAFAYFRDAVKASDAAVDAEMATSFFNALTESYKLGDITPDDYMNDYELLATALGKADQSDEVINAQAALENLFAQSGAANCENIEKIFKPRYMADKDNIEMLRKMAVLMSRAKCTSDFQMEVLEHYYELEPSSDVALMLAGIYEDRKNHDKAVQFINIAISNEQDPVKRVGYIIRAAASNLAANNYRQAADFAQKAMAEAPDNGYGYLVYASALAGGASQACTGFDRQAAYWLVTDAYVQARAKFADDQAQLDNINRTIASLAGNFPKTEDTFLRNLKPGDSYTVNCGWISGRTTVRER